MSLRVHRRAVLLAALAGLVPARGRAQPASVTVYSTRYQQEDRRVFQRFTKETGIAVELIELDVDPLIEGKAAADPAGPADLVLTVSAVTLARCAKEGLFRPLHQPAVAAVVPAQFRDKGDQWFGLSKWARVILYHKDRVDPGDIKTYEDLADPQWQERILVRSSSNVYNRALVASMIAATGIEKTEEWTKGLVANFARVPQGGDSDQITALAAGEGDLAIVNTRYFARFGGSDKVTEREVVSRIGLVFPNQEDRGTLVDVVGAGIGRQARNPDGAQLLLEFLLRADIQKLFAEGNLEYPIRSDVAPAPELQKLGSFKMDALPVGQIGRFGPEATRIMARSGWQ